MAGDIFFTNDRVWLSNSLDFVDVINRAIAKCRPGEDSLVQILSQAEAIRCLSVDRQKDRAVQIALTERVLEAAHQAVQELSNLGQPHQNAEKLIVIAQEHLNDLYANDQFQNGDPNETEIK